MKKKNNHRRGVLACANTSCSTTITPDPRHIANLTARGSWSCAHHAVTV